MEQFIGKIKKKINVQNLLLLFLICQPIIDILTSILVKNISANLTVGVFVRTIFMCVVAIYALKISDKKSRKWLFAYFVAIAIFCCAFTLKSYMENGLSMIITQLKGLIKNFYFPVILVSLMQICKIKDIKISEKTFMIIIIEYVATIVIARALGIAYRSYIATYKMGTVGLFFSANEIGAILCVLAPFLIVNVIKERDRKKLILMYVLSILFIYASLEIGTKVPLLGVIFCLVYAFIAFTINLIAKKDNRKQNIIGMVTFAVLGILIFAFLGYTPIGENLQYNYGIKIFNFNKEIDNDRPVNEVDFSDSEEATKAVVSARNEFFNNNKKVYLESNLTTKLFGMSYVVNGEELKLVEMDYIDIFFCTGIIGAIIVFIPFVAYGAMIIIKVFKKFKEVIVNREILLIIYAIGIGLGIALVAGHVLVAPAVNIYLVMEIILLNNKIDELKGN